MTWVLGFAFHVTMGGFIHILLVLAIIAVLGRLIIGRMNISATPEGGCVMKRHQSAGTSSRATPMTHVERWQAARPIVSRLAMVALGTLSVLGLSGCEAVEAIFKVGVWFGVLIVVTIVAVIGGIAALLLRKK